MSRPAILGAALLLLGVALPGAAFAQAGPAAATQDTGQGGQGPSKAMSERIEQRIRSLHDELGITPAQQEEWEKFAQVMRDNAARMDQVATGRGGRMGTMSAAENMDSYAQLAEVHAANMRELAGAFQTLYLTFPDGQKRVADRVFRDRGPIGTHRR